MELDPKNVADRGVARKIVAVRDRLTGAEKRTLSAELAKSNPTSRSSRTS